jgi:hypothetical protein
VRYSLAFAAFLTIGCGETAAAAPQTLTSYVPYQFAADEGWRLIGGGDIGASRFDHGKLSLDFTRGASWIGLQPPDRVLLGNVGKVRIRVRTTSTAHPAHLYLRTHFMAFNKTAVLNTAPDEQEIVFDGPPGPGWQWAEGENDGRIHGPIRIGKLQFEANGHNDRAEIELLAITVEGSQPANRLCVMTAKAEGVAKFAGELRCMSSSPTAGEVSWIFRDWDGKELGRGRQPVNVPARAEVLSQDFAPFTERQQAELLARAYLCTLAAGVHTNTSWYDFRNDGEDPLYFENEMGILRRDFSPKPAYWAYSTLTRMLEGRKLAGPVDAGEGVLAYRFEGRGVSVIALWSVAGDCEVRLAIPSKRVTVVNAIGEVKEVPGGNVRLELHGAAPLYVVAATD